jgi:hypothetical protein
MSAVPSGGNTVKNVIIGILTTVVAYSIVFLLGLGKHDSSGDSKPKKEATMNAFKSINDYVNYAGQKFKTIACFSCNEQDMKNEMLRELEHDCGSLRNLKEDVNIDEKMKSLIDRIIDQFNDLKPVYTIFYDSLSYIKQLPDSEQIFIINRIQQNLFKQKDFIQTRDTGDVNNYLRDINKKYKTKLAFKNIEPEYEVDALVGKWKVGCTVQLQFNQDGSIRWTEGENVFKGKWVRDGNELTIHLNNNQEFRYIISEISKKILFLFDSDTNIYLGACPE